MILHGHRATPSPLAGEGWGGGYDARIAVVKAPPSRPPSLTLRRSTSPARGEVALCVRRVRATHESQP